MVKNNLTVTCYVTGESSRLVQAAWEWWGDVPHHQLETSRKARLVRCSSGHRVLYLRTLRLYILKDPNIIHFIPSVTPVHGVQVVSQL